MNAVGPDKKLRRRWLALAVRITQLLIRQQERSTDLVRQSYDRIAPGYDDAWTHHMRDLSLRLLDHLAPPAGATCLDLNDERCRINSQAP